MVSGGGANLQQQGDDMGPLATVDNISLNTLGTTPLYAVPAGKQLVVTGAVERGTNMVGATGNSNSSLVRLSDGAFIGSAFGSGGGVFNNGEFSISSPDEGAQYPIVAGGDTVLFSITQIDGGTSAIVSVDVLGYLI
jgi:hypothetical protein